MEKQEKEPKKDQKIKKRKVSIFTIFLWLLLIIVMITIMIGSMTQKSAIEITDNNWNIQLVMYDRSSDSPNQAITDVTWNAMSDDETKQLVMQISYACTTEKVYQPGEILIEIPGIAKDSFSEYWRNTTERDEIYSYWLENNIVIAADKEESTEKQYDWSYRYDIEENKYIFTNNHVMAEDHFEGTIQIVYNLLPRFRIKTDLAYQAKIEENIQADEIIVMESNVCNFHYTGNKKTYTLKNEAIHGLNDNYNNITEVIDDYYWVKYTFIQSAQEGAIGALSPFENSKTLIDGEGFKSCIKVELPEGCVLYNENLYKTEPKEENTYYYLFAGKSTYGKYYHYYVGYPKTNYNAGDVITNTTELWGRYEDEEEIQKLAEASSTVTLKVFETNYPMGRKYDLYKDFSAGWGEVSKKGMASGNGENTDAEIKATAFYTDSLMDVEIGDDFLYATRENGETTKLTDEEYGAYYVVIPVFYTYNVYASDYDDYLGEPLIGYEWELQVRYKNTDEYVTYKTGLTKDTRETIMTPRSVVGVKLILKDLDQTLYMDTYGFNGNASFDVNWYVFAKDALVGGYVYNFCYLNVYHKDSDGNRVLVNEDEYSYPYFYDLDTEEVVSKDDLATYGRRMYRSGERIDIGDGWIELGIEKKRENITNNVADQKYEIQYNIETSIDSYRTDGDKNKVIKIYDILPLGMNVASQEQEIIDSIIDTEGSYSWFELIDGTRFKSKEQFNDYLKSITSVDFNYNYKDSGRTKIIITIDLNDLSFESLYVPEIIMNMTLDTEVSYDSILEYGFQYDNYIYGMWENQEYEYDTYYTTIKKDNGIFDTLATDLDEDGNLEESVICYHDSLTITHANSSQQAVLKQVKTDLTRDKYVLDTASVKAGENYEYKLRVTTGANSLKDLILYDNIETILDDKGVDVSQGWKGKFLGVDTSYAKSKGYAPKVYYSTELNPGKLTEVPDKWKPLDDSVDKSTVKSICVDLRYKEDGSEMELSPNNVVFVLIKMQAVEDETLKTSASNMFWTNWRATDPLGGVTDNIEGIYSNQVNVEIYTEFTEISVKKIWEDHEDEAGKRPSSITLQIKNGETVVAEQEVSETTSWEYTFKDLPKYDSLGNKINYTIDEKEELKFYTKEVTENTIINTFKVPNDKIKIVGQKEWQDNENEAGKRPESVTLQVKVEGIVIAEAEANDENLWRCEWELPKYDRLGNEIFYTVDEKEVDIPFYEKVGIEENVVINQFVVPDEKVQIKVQKTWDDNENEAGKRPTSVTLQVKRQGKVVAEQEVNEITNWEYTFELPKYDNLGNEISYTVDEVFESEFYIKNIVGNVITNKFVVPEDRITIIVKKEWNDDENKAGKRPESVILQVKNGENIVAEAEVSEKTNWIYSFELEKYDKYGNEIEYSVDEKETNEYYEKYINGNTIINTYIYEQTVETSDISVWIYVVIALIAILGISGILIIKNRQKKSLKK